MENTKLWSRNIFKVTFNAIKWILHETDNKSSGVYDVTLSQYEDEHEIITNWKWCHFVYFLRLTHLNLFLEAFSLTLECCCVHGDRILQEKLLKFNSVFKNSPMRGWGGLSKMSNKMSKMSIIELSQLGQDLFDFSDLTWAHPLTHPSTHRYLQTKLNYINKFKLY